MLPLVFVQFELYCAYVSRQVHLQNLSHGNQVYLHGHFQLSVQTLCFVNQVLLIIFFFFIFCRYMPIIDWRKHIFNVSEAIGYLSSLIWKQPQLAVFFAYFPVEERPDSQDILFLRCYPKYMREVVVAELERDNIKSLSSSDSTVKMIPGHHKAYVSLSGGIRAVDEDDMDNFYLMYVCNEHID